MSRNVNPVPQFPYAPSGKMYYYQSGQNTLIKTFSNSAQTIENLNPVPLDSIGRLPSVFFSGTARQVLVNAGNTQQWERDPVGDSDPAGEFAAYNAQVSYDINDIVTASSGLFYISLQNANQNNSPSSSAGENEWWMEKTFIDVFNTKKTYLIGNIVKTTEGYLWRSVTNSNLNNLPSTDDGTNWLSAIDATKAFSSVTTASLIASTKTYATGHHVETSVYNAGVNNGGGTWVKTAGTGTASQSPAQRVDGKLTDGNGSVWQLEHGGVIKISQLGAIVGTDAANIFLAYAGSDANLLDLENKTWVAPTLNCDNVATRALLKSKVFNGTLESANSAGNKTNIQHITVTEEDAAPLVDNKSSIINWLGKKVLWLGTSIPHQGADRDGYPEKFGELMQSNIYNWAWSGSHAFYDIAGASDQIATIKSLSMTEADRLAGLALYGSSSVYDDSFDAVTKASSMTADYRIEAQFAANAMDVVVLDHNHNDRKNDATYTANDKTITAVTLGSTTVFAVNNITGLAVGNGCYARVTGIANLDYMAGRISAVAGSNVTVAFNSTGLSGTFSAGTLHFVDRNTIQGSFDFLIAYTKNSSIRNGNGDVKIILANAPSYYTQDVDRDFGIWHVGRAIKAVADAWGLAYFDVAHAMRITFKDQLVYLPDGIHPSTPESRDIFANYWTRWANGGVADTYNPALTLQKNTTLTENNNYAATYSKYEEQYTSRATSYDAGTDVINDDFSGNLSAWTVDGATPPIVNAPWGGGQKAVEFDGVVANTAQRLIKNVAIGQRPYLSFDFYINDITISDGTSKQLVIAAINDSGGQGGYGVTLIQTLGGDLRLQIRYNAAGFGAVPVLTIPFPDFIIESATKYTLVFDVVDGYALFTINGVKIYAGKIANSLLVAPAKVLIGTVFSSTGTDYKFYIGNVIAKSKSIIDLYPSSSITAPLHIQTFAALELLNPTQTGQVFICDGRAGAKYILQESGYTALAGDATFANNRVASLTFLAGPAVPYIYPEHFGSGDDVAVDAYPAISLGKSRLTNLGGVLKLSRFYLHSQTININTDNTLVDGNGRGTGLTRSNGSFGDSLVFEAPDPTTTTHFRAAVSNLEIKATVEMNSGALLRITEAAYYTLQNVSLQNGFIGFHGQGIRAGEIDILHIRSGQLWSEIKVGSRFCLLEDSPRVSSFSENVELFMSNFNFTTNGTEAYVEYGLEVKEADGIWFDNGHIRGAAKANGFLNAASSPQLLGLKFDNVWFDGLTEKCLLTAGVSSGYAGFVRFNDCSFTGGTIHAVHTSAGSTMDWIEFNNCNTWLIDNQITWNIQAGANVIVNNPTFKALNSSNEANASMILVGADVENFVSNGGSLFDSPNIDFGVNINATVNQATVNGMAFRDLADSAQPIALGDSEFTVYNSAGCTTDQTSGYVKGNAQRGEKLNIADNTAVNVNIGECAGATLSVGLKLNLTAHGLIAIETEGTASIAIISGAANLEVATGVLSGTTGNDGKLTVSITDAGVLYFENRTGVTRSLVWKILSRDL